MRINRHSFAILSLLASTAAQGQSAGQSAGQPTVPTPPQVDPDILHEALGLGAREQLQIYKDGCASVMWRVESEPKFVRVDRAGGPCTNGMVDGRSLDSEGKASFPYHMGRLGRYRVQSKADGLDLVLLPGDSQSASYSLINLPKGKDDIIGEGLKPDTGFLLQKSGVELVSLSKQFVPCPVIQKATKTEIAILEKGERALLEKALKYCKGNTLTGNAAPGLYQIAARIRKEANKSETPTKRDYLCAIRAPEQTDVDHSTCGAKWDEIATPYKPLMDSIVAGAKAGDERNMVWAAEQRANLGTRIEGIKTRLAKAKEDEKRMAAMALVNRQNAFLATIPTVKAAPAIGAFAPVLPQQAGVIFFGNNSEPDYSISVDEDLLELSPTLPLKTANDDDLIKQKEGLKRAVEELKLAGAKTLYLFYFDRRHMWRGPVAFRPRTERVLLSSTTVDNPEYASAEAEMNAAKSAMDSAQSAYDIENRRANSGGYGTGAAALAGLAPGIAAANRLSKAQTRYYAARDRFGRMSPQTKNESWANAAMGDISYHVKARFPLVMYACDLATSSCAEKERVVEHEAEADRPLTYYTGETSATLRKQQIDGANKTLYDFEKKLNFGFSVAALGDYFKGANMAIPLDKITEYTAFADKIETKAFDASTAALDAKRAPIYVMIKELASSLPRGYQARDVITTAIAEAQVAERRSTLQGLE